MNAELRQFTPNEILAYLAPLLWGRVTTEQYHRVYLAVQTSASMMTAEDLARLVEAVVDER